MADINRLTARRVETLKAPGRHADGGGLYLVVKPGGSKHWAFIFRWDGKLKEMGLGGLKARAGKPPVGLADARGKAEKARKILDGGKNPIEVGIEDKVVPTFGEAARRYIEAHEGSWRNAKHRDQWRMTLLGLTPKGEAVAPALDYCAKLRGQRVDAIDTAAVLSVLKPVWQSRPETASRLRGRVEAVLDAAKALGERDGENPAMWRGHLRNLLPARQKLTRGHHAAMPYSDVPAFIAELRAREAVAALALEFAILTAARSGEALGATWGEIDLGGKLWVVPAARMKAGREHRVPLSAPAVALLEKAAPLMREDGLIFPGQRKNRPLSNMAFAALLERMKRTDVTAHGFRSAFRDWAGEASSFPTDLAEAALAHQRGDATERAYARGDLLAKRARLMEAWASYCARPAASDVAQFGKRATP